MAFKSPNDLSFYQALAKHHATVRFFNRKIIKEHFFLDHTRINNQGIMHIDFALKGHERKNSLKNLLNSMTTE